MAKTLKTRLESADSQYTLARELGISQSYLNLFLHGERRPGPAILKALGFEPTPYYRKAES